MAVDGVRPYQIGTRALYLSLCILYVVCERTPMWQVMMSKGWYKQTPPYHCPVRFHHGAGTTGQESRPKALEITCEAGSRRRFVCICPVLGMMVFFYTKILVKQNAVNQI